MRHSKGKYMGLNVTVGTAPVSWGVFFPNDPKQTSYSRFLDEVVEAGYEWTELGPPGYLPLDPEILKANLEPRGVKVTTGFVMRHFEDPVLWPIIEAETIRVATALEAVGAKFLLLIDDTYTHLATGEQTSPSSLDESSWRNLIETVHRVSSLARERFGLQAVFHPHVETHVEYEHQIEAFLEQTDPTLVSLCFDIGHHAYRRGNPIQFMRRHHRRIPYLHLKSVDGEMLKRVEKEKIPLAKAVAMGVFCEPSKGVVDFADFRDVLEDIDYQGWAIVEQDMFPATVDEPLPIAKRTRQYLRNIGIG